MAKTRRAVQPRASFFKTHAQGTAAVALFLSLCLYGFCMFRLIGSDPYLDTDLGGWVHNAHNLLLGVPLISDDMNWVYLAPFNTVLYYLAGLASQGMYWPYLPTFISGLITLMVWALIFRQWNGGRFSWIIAAILASLAMDASFASYLVSGLPESSVVAFISLGYFLFLQAEKAPAIRQKILWAAATILLMISLLTKPVAILGIGYLFFLDALLRRPKNLKISFIVPSAALILYFLGQHFIVSVLEDPAFLSVAELKKAQGLAEVPSALRQLAINLIKSIMQLRHSLPYARQDGLIGGAVTIFFLLSYLGVYRCDFFTTRSPRDRYIFLAMFLLPIFMLLPMNFVIGRRFFMLFPGWLLMLWYLLKKPATKTTETTADQTQIRTWEVLVLGLFVAFWLILKNFVASEDAPRAYFYYGLTTLGLLLGAAIIIFVMNKVMKDRKNLGWLCLPLLLVVSGSLIKSTVIGTLEVFLSPSALTYWHMALTTVWGPLGAAFLALWIIRYIDGKHALVFFFTLYLFLPIYDRLFNSPANQRTRMSRIVGSVWQVDKKCVLVGKKWPMQFASLFTGHRSIEVWASDQPIAADSFSWYGEGRSYMNQVNRNWQKYLGSQCYHVVSADSGVTP